MENKDQLNPEKENEKGAENLKSEMTMEKESEILPETQIQEKESANVELISDSAKKEVSEPSDSKTEKETDLPESSKPDPDATDPSENILIQQDLPATDNTAEIESETSTTDDEVVPAKKVTATRKKAKAKAKEEVTEAVKEKTTEPKSESIKTADELEEDDAESHDLSEKYNTYTKEQLIEIAEALVQNEDVNYIRKHIGYVKVAFRNHLKSESVTHFEKNIQSDEESEVADQTLVSDPLVTRFDNAFSVYKQKKNIYDQALERQKQDNLVTKEKILEELRNLIESEEELKKTYDVFKELQEQWREIGPVPQSSKNTLWNNYHFLVEKFFDKVKINKELRDLDLKKNLEIKTELCEKAEELLLESSINKSFQQLQKLHEAWKEIGPVPKDKKDEIWDRFKAATDALNERRQGYYDELREDQNKNYTAKLVLCEKAEQLTDFVADTPKDWQKATDQINELFNLWKTIGFAPKKVNNEVWTRFRGALDSFFRNKKAFFQKYKDEQSENYNQKLNLCMQAEALKDSEDWKHTTDELIALQQQWKTIGPVPNKFSDKIWKRFRAACDAFFNRKSEYFSNIGEKQDDNLRMKKELIEKVKNFAYTADNSENLNVLKDFQREFMDIGHVPIKFKDQIQNEFRKAVNDQFDKLNISRKAKTAIGFKNKIENIKNSPNADNIIYKERTFLINKINGLQNDIKLWENNIGFFASSKKADILKSEFEQKIERAKNEIVILEEKLKIIRES